MADLLDLTGSSSNTEGGLRKKIEGGYLFPSPVREDKDDTTAAPSIPEYLESTVLGPLTEGLEDLCRQRPANPIDHLALFLLRRSKSNATVEVSEKDAVPVEPPKRT